nr:immunoglobulin heavy chain junction region [Mus musculus]
CTRNPTVDW